MDDFDRKCKIVQNAALGRYVTAAVDIKAGETVLLEQPVLVMPHNGNRRCANCWKMANQFCSRCQIFSLCDECTEHNAADCSFLSQAPPECVAELQRHHSEILALLQCLLLREDAERQPQFVQMCAAEAHLQQRRGTDVWTDLGARVVAPMLGSGFVRCLRQSSAPDDSAIDEEMLQRLLGVLDVNSFEMRGPDEASVRGLYLRGLLFSHSCVANLVVAIDDQFQIKMYANRDIASGEILHHCYTNALLCTDERRHMLKSGKYFECDCARCRDPTELGSHMSSLICAPCAAQKQDGYVVKHCEGKVSKWQCLRCGHTMPSANVESILERAREETFHAQQDLYRMELLLAKLAQILHRSHYLMIDLKQNIAAILRAIIMNPSQRPGVKVYQRKVRLCQEILVVLHTLQPGISRLRAIALYELCSAQADLARLRYADGELEQLEYLRLLQQSEAMLRESIRMMLHEPPNTPEGRLAKNMLHELKQLQSDMKTPKAD